MRVRRGYVRHGTDVCRFVAIGCTLEPSSAHGVVLIKTNSWSKAVARHTDDERQSSESKGQAPRSANLLLSSLLDQLVAIRLDLSYGTVPPGELVTCSVEELQLIADRLQGAILIAKQVVDALDARPLGKLQASVHGVGSAGSS